MQALADIIANYLRGPGEFLRELTLAIPMPVAKGIFLLYFAILLVWILTMRKSEMVGELPGKKTPINLRPYAAAAMIGQIVIYLIF